MTHDEHQNNAHDDTLNSHPARFLEIKRAAKMIGIITAMAFSISAQGNDGLVNSTSQTRNAAAHAPVKNDKPEARTDIVGLKASSVAFNALANDADANGDRLIMVEATAKYGAVAFTPEGLLAYAQNPGPARADKITYVVSDGRGGFDKGEVEIWVQ